MGGSHLFLRLKCLLVLVLLTIVDIGPVPVMGMFCLYLLLLRPTWFKDLVDMLYSSI